MIGAAKLSSFSSRNKTNRYSLSLYCLNKSLSHLIAFHFLQLYLNVFLNNFHAAFNMSYII